MPTVFVIGRDWTFRTLVRAELREQGVEALGFETVLDARADTPRGITPEAVVFDSSSTEAPLSANLAELGQFPGSMQVVVITSAMEELPADGALPEQVRGRGLVVLKKPVRVAEVLAAVRRLLEGHPA